jgi:hypothetical protein
MGPLIKLQTYDLSNGRAEPFAETDLTAFRLPPSRGRGIVMLPTGFPEANLFCLLKSLFGRPNGLMSLALGHEGDASALFKYEWMVKLADGTGLSFMRSWLGCEVHGKGRNIELDEIVSMITHNFNLHSFKIKETLAQLEPYRLIINPHFRHRAMMNFYHKELGKLDYQPPTPPKDLLVAKGNEKAYTKQVQNYLRGMTKQNAFAVSVVTESAFVAESYLNLLIAFLKNRTLESNTTMFRDALLEKWRDKTERLPLHCRYFMKSPDVESDPVKNIKRVFDLRNKIAHSYPDVDDLCTAKMWFDLKIPVLPKCESYVLYEAGSDALLPQRAEALGCPALVAAFIAYINSLLKPEVGHEIAHICDINPLGYSEKTKRYGVPFRKEIAMGFFGVGPSDKS